MKDIAFVRCMTPKFRRVTKDFIPLNTHPTLQTLIVSNQRGYRVRIYAEGVSMTKNMFHKLPHPATPRDVSIAWIIKQFKRSEVYIEDATEDEDFFNQLGEDTRERLYTAIAEELLIDAFFRVG